MTHMTIIKSIKPLTLGKRYELDADGKITKSVVANIWEGEAIAGAGATPERLASLLKHACEASDVALMSGRFLNAKSKEPVNLVTERRLADVMGCELQAVPGGVQLVDGEKCAARVKRGIEPGCWILIDADNPAGIPEELAAMTLQERLEFLEPIVPGIRICTRVEYRASSARVVKNGQKPGGATHAWIQISDAAQLEVLREHVRVQMQLQDRSFPSPRYSRETGQIIGSEARTVIDLAVWLLGRLVFCSKPEVLMDGYHVAEAGVKIVNPDGGMLDVSGIDLPSQADLAALREKTGQQLAYSRGQGSLTVKDHSALTLDTPIEVKGHVRALREVVNGMKPDEKLRCETPFRASQSEAAFIRILDDGSPMLHDVGTSTTYYLADEVENAPDGHRGIPSWVEEFNAKYAWVESQKTFYRYDFGDFIKQGELVTQHKNRPLIVQVADGQDRRQCRVAAWIGHPDRAQYRDLVFAPGELAITSQNDINTWTGFAVEPTEGCIEPYEHLRDYLFPDPQECKYVEQWLAHKLKHPGVKMNTALVVWSQAEGVGKNLLFETIGQIIGSRHSCVIGQKDLNGDFNSWAKNRLFVIGDEVLNSGKRQEADRLKGLITGTTLRINEKNQPEYDIANLMSFVFLSNHCDAVHLDAGSRRFFVSEIKAAPLSEAFYDAYADWRDSGGLAALHHYLTNDVDLTGFDPKAPAPQTAAKVAMVSAGRSGLEQWMVDALQDPIDAFGGAVITAELLKAEYERSSGDSRSTLKAIGNAATKAGAVRRASQVRLSNVKGAKRARVMSLTDHDAWANRSEPDWAEELERVRQHLLCRC